MNQANQKQVIQEANMNLVQIRTYELQYFSDFFSNFGTQSALMVGFVAASLSQVPGTENPTGAPYFFLVLYWTSSAACCVTGMHSLVCSVFLQVFGQGLALRGPVGSMVRAIEGMVVEQQHVFVSFVLTIFFFGFQAIGMYWLMMDQKSAIASSVATLVGMAYWYRYSLRVYNRFSWNNMKVDWQDDEDPEEELDDLNPSAIKSPKAKGGSSQNDGVLRGIELFQAGDTEVTGGYLTIRCRGMFGRDPWQRQYFVIRENLIYYYKDKRAFELDPSKPINRRPIDLEGYTLVAGAVEPPYAISLVPIDPDDIRKAWKFRCDTMTEFKNWVETFSKALQKCESSHGQGALVNVMDNNKTVLDDDEDDE